MSRTLKRIALAASLALALGTTAPVPTFAADVLTLTRADLGGRVVHLGVGKSMVVDLPADVKDILVSNPAAADAVLRTSRQLFIIGTAIGESSVVLFGSGGTQLGEIDLVVGRDMVGLESMIQAIAPGSTVQLRSIGDIVVLSGSVPSAEVSQQIADLSAKFMGGAEKVVNSLTLAGSDQVNLRVVIAEVQRNVARDLGVEFDISKSIGGVTFNAIQDYLPSAGGADFGVSGDGFNGTIRALQEDGVLRTLAEPNLTAISGESANFLVGGEVPVLASIDDGVATYSYKPYGVGLSFTPVVLSSGRIVLRIKTEISELDPANGTEIFTAFKTRRAETTVELPSGGSIAIGGLLQDEHRRNQKGTPGLMEIPILGALFKSANYQRKQTELVIFVTPYTVVPVATSKIQRPDKNLTFSRDAQNLFLNQVNRIYSPNATPSGSYVGNVGFAFE